MKGETLFKKICNFFLHVFLAIISFFKKLFGSSEKSTNNKVNVQENKIIKKKEENVIDPIPTTLPDTANVNANNHSSEDNANINDDIILKLTNEGIKKIKKKEIIVTTFTDDEIDELINECLEEEYQEEGLKLKEANKVLKEKIKEFKEEIVYTIKENVVKKQITAKDNLKQEIKEIIKEEIKVKPIMPKIQDLKEQGLVEKQNHIYFLATPLKKVLQIKEEEKVVAKANVLVTIPDKDILKQKLNEKPYFMVQNEKEVPKESVKEDLKNAAIMGGMIGAKAVLDLVTPLPKEEKDEAKVTDDEVIEAAIPEVAKEDVQGIKEDIIKEEEKKAEQRLALDEDKPPVVNSENVLEAEILLPKLKELEEQLEEIHSKTIKEKAGIPSENQEEVKEKKPDVEVMEKEALEDKDSINKDELTTPLVEDKEEKKTEKKDLRIEDKINNDILKISLVTASLISSSKEEAEKKELEDKDYDKKEEQINKMLDDIELTLLKYDGKMSEKQKSKLKQEQERLRDTKDHLATKKQEDINREAYLLDETIKEVELNGLQNELKRLHVENQIEMNESLLGRINGLENLTQEQIANIDKKMLMKRLNKVSALMEMSSILALPFVRNKYFFYFTIGLIIDNHFNFINAFFKRRINRYKPADLEQIKQGEDALNSALNMTYKNQIQLEYVVNEALTRYPELANEPLFTNKVNNLRMQLEHSYQKMMNKKNIMEKYHRKTKSQIKVLKRTGDLEEAA